MSKRHYVRVRIEDEVEVDVSDVLDDLDTDDLIEELRKRKQAMPRGFVGTDDMIEDLRDAFARRDGMHFEVLLARLRAAWGHGYEIAPEARKALKA